MKKKLYFLFCFCICFTSHAQTKSDRYFSSYAGTTLLDLGYGPVIKKVFENQHYNERNIYASLFTFTYDARYNLLNFKTRSSLSISSPISLGITLFNYGIGAINIPILFDFNQGMHSTKANTDKNGFQISLGINNHFGPIYKFTSAEVKSFWTNAAVRIAYKFPYKNRNRYISFIGGWDKKQSITLYYLEQQTSDIIPYYFNISIGNLIHYELY